MEIRNREEILKDVLEYLNSHRILTMATSDKDGNPNATALEYANDDLVVFVSIFPKSKKVQNIMENPKVFYEIHEDIPITETEVKKLKALQIRAKPEIIKPDNKDFDIYFNIMKEKFPVFQKLRKNSRYILKFEPEIVWYLNYQQKFFKRERVDF